MSAPERSVLVGLLGDHTTGSVTPRLHESEAARQGIPLVYRALDPEAMGEASPDWPELVRTAQRFGYDALNVTHPAKQAVLAAVSELSEEAELLGAVNTVLFRGGAARGENTDHVGFRAALDRHGVDPAEGPVVQFGAGGAGAAVAYALLRAGAPLLTLVDVDGARSTELADRLSAAFDRSRIALAAPADHADAVRAAAGVVNCTPIGMAGVSDASPVDLDALHPGLWVGDAVYRPRRTLLVRAADALGCHAFGGTDMVVGQAVAAFELFTGHRASPDAMSAAFDAASA